MPDLLPSGAPPTPAFRALLSSLLQRAPGERPDRAASVARVLSELAVDNDALTELAQPWVLGEAVAAPDNPWVTTQLIG